MYSDFERLHSDVYALLRSLGIKADNTHFFYTAYAIALVADLPLRGTFFVPLVLLPAARLYGVSISTVRDAVYCTAEKAFQANTPLFAIIFPIKASLSAPQFVTRLAAYISKRHRI